MGTFNKTTNNDNYAIGDNTVILFAPCSPNVIKIFLFLHFHSFIRSECHFLLFVIHFDIMYDEYYLINHI